jgi:L-threonylcarbamoyladenylate synthase
LRLLEDLNFPLAAPSANRFGRISPTSAEHVFHDLSGRIPMILNGGSCGQGIESTIVGMSDLGDPFILRQGSITQQMLEEQIGKVAVFHDYVDLPLAPGMLKRHYAPETTSFLVEDISKWMEKTTHLKVGIMRFSQWRTFDENTHLRILSEQGDLAEAAQNLYATMRELDQSEYDLLLFEKFPNTDLGVAINDKLDRATRSLYEIRKYFKR